MLFIPADRSGAEFAAADRNTPDYELNNALERADISQSFEVYLDILERFYADDIELFVDEPHRQIIGKGAVRAFLLSFLVPIHVIAEVGRSLSLGSAQVDCKRDSRYDCHSLGGHVCGSQREALRNHMALFARVEGLVCRL